MKRIDQLALGLAGLFAIGVIAASAQVITNPPIAVPIGCAYNTSPVTLTNGQAGWVQCNNAGALVISGSITPSGTQDVNLAQVAGATVATGAGTAAGSVRVELPTDGTGKVGLNAGSAIIGNVRIDQTTPGTTNGVVLNTNPTANTYVGNVNTQGTKATYSATTAAPAIDAAGTLIQIQGSASKTIRVTKVEISGVLTTTSNGVISINRCTTAVSGGTSASVTPVAYDSTSAAVTAVATRWTAVGTAGSCSIVATRRSTWTADTLADAAPALFKFGDANAQPIVLRGTSEYLTVSTTTFTSYTGGSYTAYIEWTEE